MQQEGPKLESLLHRLSDCPSDFLERPRSESSGIDVYAIVCDHLRRMTPDRPPELDAALRSIRGIPPNHQSVLSVACWLLHDDWFLARPALTDAMRKLLLGSELASLATLVTVKKLVGDPDRREEFVRVCLRELGLRPQGESEVQAADRLTTLDSAERVRVVKATAAAERRAREVREAMAKKAARDAASRYGE